MAGERIRTSCQGGRTLDSLPPRRWEWFVFTRLWNIVEGEAGMAADQIAYPEWTDYRDKSGLDPLGMQNSSINLYQRLLPGISNVTLRMRYYGLYAWLATGTALSGHRQDTTGSRWLARRPRCTPQFRRACAPRALPARVLGALQSKQLRISFRNGQMSLRNRPYECWFQSDYAWPASTFRVKIGQRRSPKKK